MPLLVARRNDRGSAEPTATTLATVPGWNDVEFHWCWHSGSNVGRFACPEAALDSSGGDSSRHATVAGKAQGVSESGDGASMRIADFHVMAVGVVEPEHALAPRLNFNRMDDSGAGLDHHVQRAFEIVRLEVDIDVVFALRNPRECARLLVYLLQQVRPVVDREAVLAHQDLAVVMTDRLAEDVAEERRGSGDVADEDDCFCVGDLQASPPSIAAVRTYYPCGSSGLAGLSSSSGSAQPR